MRAVLLMAVWGGLLGLAGPAAGATTFGSTLQSTPVFGALPNSVSTEITGAGISATAPSSGVLTAIRVRHGTVTATPGAYAYRILTGSASPFEGRPATPSGANDVFLAWTPGAPAGIDTYYPTDASGERVGIPIAAGERIGLWTQSTATAFWSSSSGPEAARHDGGDHVSGSAPYSNFASFEALIQGTLEPDNDGDHYGDETQDGCPTSAATHRSCPPPPAGGGGGPPPPTKPAKASFRGSKASISVSARRVFRFAFRAAPGLTGSAAVRAKRLTLARQSFTVATSGKVTLRLKLSRKSFRSLKRKRKIETTLTVKLTNAAGSTTATKRVTLKAPRSPG